MIWLFCLICYIVYIHIEFFYFLLHITSMKKIYWMLFAGFLGLSLFVWFASASSSDCLNIKFDNWDSVCLDIVKSWSKTFKLSINKSNISRPSSLTCRITLPNSYIYFLDWCNWTFSYAWTNTKQVLLSVSYTNKNNRSYFNWISTNINFKNWSWAGNTRTLNSWEWSRNTRTSTRSNSTSTRYNNSNDEIELSTNKTSPSTNQYINLTISTDDDYVGKLSFSAKYKNSSSSSWSSISTLTSYTYFSDYSDEWDDGYYKMKSSDDGEVTLKNLVKFRKSGYYRIYVTDTDWNESYIQFSVGDVDEEGSSNVSWFSSSELKKVKNLYNQWNDLIEQLKKRYSFLKKDYFWRSMSEDFYDDMKDIINNKRPRDLSNYDEFKDAFNDRYDYTMDRI